ncbi:MAG: cardiolipin synthase ClsB [Nitrosomonadales bacterium]|nr:cardiolipin synthase ClsB [Nitrosomonadales bacterium]
MKGLHQIDGNRLTLLQNGTEYFPELCADIDAAQHSIYLETYIFAADDTGRMVANALQRAASRGVSVRLLLDGFGSAELPQDRVDDLRTAGVEVQWFRRKRFTFTLRRNRLRRLHRKMAVMDGEVAYIGGINIIDDIPADGDFAMPRLDYAVRIQGTTAGEIHVVMRRLWSAVSWANLRKRMKKLERMLAVGTSWHATSASVVLLLRDNLRHRRDIERAYLKALAGAQREVVIANAYFLPGRIFRRALVQAAQRGVRVVLLLQGKVEYRLQHYATHALYDQLLAAGIEIYEYQASYLHAKVAVVDGAWATVGSSNIDPFSLLLAREANLMVQDAGFAAELRASLFDAIAQDASRIDPAEWRTLGWGARLLVRFSYASVRMAMGVLGYGKRLV